jgi:tRNA (mo5U34)-methyltransferase
VERDELRREIERLGPWHIDVEVAPGISTGDFSDAYRPRESFLSRLARIYPGGLEGRSVLDCACNCGAYSFFAKELGAGRCFGFDAREQWIAQARFLAEYREKPTDDMRFEVLDLYELQQLGIGRFDVAFFFGIFYHLHDPVTGLKAAADLTDELLILNTKARPNRPDGMLVQAQESPDGALAGTRSLCWFPTGPGVLTSILNWLGFPEVRCSHWLPSRSEDLDRIEMLAARTPGFFEHWDETRSAREVIESTTNPRSRGRLSPARTG